ncbi:MAG TPA: CDP-diacylglycerol--glycerol-3-phosphate 3-phosphatidyltransferase [Candidatus Acidoferrum sp.]|nr:CDP-diacylglycerol--glycerol-3-phosphate 3-phosphatidyltransferase [Candidatus Acidoferrum sp.]
MLTDLPNLLTLSRIIIIPVLVGLFYLDGDVWRWVSVLLFSLAGVTDYFDGYLARKWAQISALGRFLDPIADKLLVAAVILMLVARGHITGWVVLPALVILCREVMVSGLREFLAQVNVGVPVSRLAKWKTALQLIALGILIVGDAAGDWTQFVGETGLWIAAAITMITGYDYLSAGLKHMTPRTKPAKRTPEPQGKTATPGS